MSASSPRTRGHPNAFAVRRLEELPLLLKVRAKAALDGSVQEIAKFRDLVKTSKCSASTLHPSLVVAYRALSTRSPASDGSALSESRLSQDARTAYVALDLVACVVRRGRLNVSYEDTLSLWTHAWPWIRFIDSVGSSLASTDYSDEAVFNHLNIVRSIIDFPQAARSILCTPGLYHWIGRTCGRFSDAGTSSMANRYLAATHVAEFLVLHRIPLMLSEEDPDNKDYLDEFLDGIGDACDIAHAVTSQMLLAFPTPDSVADRRSVSILRAAFLVVAHSLETNGMVYPRLLVSCGLLQRVMTGFLAILSASPDVLAKSWCKQALDLCTAGVYQCTGTPPRPHIRSQSSAIRRAMELGLLPAIRRYLSILDSTDDIEEVITYARGLIAHWLVYPDVIALAQASNQDTIDNLDTEDFRDARAAKAWLSLIRTVRLRWDCLQVFRALPKEDITRMCDLPSCTGRQRLRDLKQCGCCRRVFYCSAVCQRQHWILGHREQCRQQMTDGSDVALYDPRPFTPDQEAFIQWLLAHEHQRHEYAIACGLVDYLLLHRSSADIPCILFDFGDGPPNIAVDCLVDHSIPCGISEDHLARAAEGTVIYVLSLEGNENAPIATFPAPQATATDRWEYAKTLVAAALTRTNSPDADALKKTLSQWNP